MVNASDPQIVSDPNGNLVAAWIEEGVVKANTRLFGGSWGRMAATVSNMGASLLQLAVDGAGNATAVWEESGAIASSSLPFGGNWSAETILSGSGATAPQVAADPTGDVIAVWVENGGVLSKTKPAMQDWPSVADTLAASGDSPQIALNANSTAAAVWHSLLNTIDTIYFSTKSVGGSWSSGIAISNNVYNSVYPKIAIDSSGNILAAWYRYSLSNQAFTNVIVQAAYRPLNGSWQPPVDLSASGLRNPSDLSITLSFNKVETGVLFWINSYDGSTFTYEASALTSTGWVPSVPLLLANLYAYAGTFSVNASGYAFGTFMCFNAESGNIEIQSFQVNTNSSFVNRTGYQTVSSGAVNGYPSIASTFIGGLNQIAAVWMNYDGIATVQTAPGISTPISPPINLSVAQTSQSFGLFTEYMNTLSWDSSPDPSLAGFLVYRNGQKIGSGPGNMTTFVDPNQAQNGPVTYGISFFTSNGDQSAATSVNFP